MYKLKNVLLGAMSFVGLSMVLSMALSSCGKGGTTTILGNWKIRSEFNGVARSEAVSFVIGDSAFIGTGYDGTNRLSDMWEYQPAQNNWVQKADFPGVPRQSELHLH